MVTTTSERGGISARAIRGWLVRRRFRRALSAAYEERRARMPWLQLCAALHHSQHPGEIHDDCGTCNPQHLARMLDQLAPLPEDAPNA